MLFRILKINRVIGMVRVRYILYKCKEHLERPIKPCYNDIVFILIRVITNAFPVLS